MRPDRHLAGSAVAPFDPSGAKLQDNMRSAFHMACRQGCCERLKLCDPEVHRRIGEGAPLVSADFAIPYPPGFPIVVPGRVIEAVTIESMRKLDVYVPEEF